jgi:hypothetical protein
VIRRRVVGAADRPLGWMVYMLRASGRAEVLQLAAGDAHMETVLGHLLRDVHERGGTQVVGRLEPQLLDHVARWPFVLRAGPIVLLHSRDDALLAAARSGAALLTRLDGEWRAT